MAEARQKDDWDHTSSVLCLIANVNRDPKKGRRMRPHDFHPFRSTGRTGLPLRADNLHALKRAFVKRGKGKRKRAARPHPLET
ncbi:MAG TPA: hypothetical protein VMW52_02015 [Phycisphaerae bacterium]|nr:hypothetical protein [Phycisphaerae bacterium]